MAEPVITAVDPAILCPLNFPGEKLITFSATQGIDDATTVEINGFEGSANTTRWKTPDGQFATETSENVWEVRVKPIPVTVAGKSEDLTKNDLSVDHFIITVTNGDGESNPEEASPNPLPGNQFTIARQCIVTA